VFEDHLALSAGVFAWSVSGFAVILDPFGVEVVDPVVVGDADCDGEDQSIFGYAAYLGDFVL